MRPGSRTYCPIRNPQRTLSPAALTFLLLLLPAIIPLHAQVSLYNTPELPDTMHATVTWVRSGTVLEVDNGPYVALLGSHSSVQHDVDAADFVRDIAFKKEVRLTNIMPVEYQVEKERLYLLAYVELEDGADLGEELLARGLARADTARKHPRSARYAKLNDWARENRIGYWPQIVKREEMNRRKDNNIGVDGKPLRDPDDLNLHFNSKKRELQRCFQILRRKSPALHGTIRVKFTILADGTVRDAYIKERDWNDGTTGKQVERCILGKVLQWQYEPIQKGTIETGFRLMFR